MATMVFAPFMPTRCWMAPEMPTAMYSLGATVWPGTAHLPLHGQPAGVADRPRGGQFGAERVGQFLHQRDVVLLP